MKSSKKLKLKNSKVVVVSGGFDPIHIGHIRMFQEAKKLGDKLIVIVNNDNWLKMKKGKEFMKEYERKEIIEAIVGVDRVVISKHTKNTKDRSVCKELYKIQPDIFANGGDRFADNVPEAQLCRKLGIKMVFNIGQGGKVRSSSDLLKKYSKHLKK